MKKRLLVGCILAMVCLTGCGSESGELKKGKVDSSVQELKEITTEDTTEDMGKMDFKEGESLKMDQDQENEDESTEAAE